MILLFLGFLTITVISQVCLYWLWPSMGIVNVISIVAIFSLTEDVMKETKKRIEERERKCLGQQD